MASQPLLTVDDLKTYFYQDGRIGRAVDGISYTLEAGKTLALVGESGCGKTVSALSILRLVPPPGKIAGGDIQFRGKPLQNLSEKEMRKIRGNEISMIFQEPMTSLNPVFTVGNQISEAITVHRGLGRRDAREETVEMLRQVGIPSPEKRVSDYPHQMSGGMRQRVMIAMALACNPSLLIADEPTTALDVTVQAQILDLLTHLQETFGMAILLITHDLGIVAETADHVAVMYAGKIVEKASVTNLFANPSHPYTQSLFESLPQAGHRGEPLKPTPGTVPNPAAYPDGCRFHPRCTKVLDRCRTDLPIPIQVGASHETACWLHE